MDYADMLRDGATPTEIREYLVEGETTAVTIRIPKNLRDSAKKAAALRGTNLSALIRECMIEELIKRG
ncbi:YlcI/YnfO family protein [uncultured Slackia sp.]|uniref:YlcI/YnfO family protein n=1 Tax=uncultured Slackia sp. TaxID=665903 RepID=UPI0025F0451E|nr:YlcI/YnfO family protein [uncultured Slackia sp.]